MNEMKPTGGNIFNKRLISKKILFLVPLSVALLFSAGCGPGAPKVGDRVWAQWTNNAWYHGRVDRTTSQGFLIVFDDGYAADLPASLIAVDRWPSKDDVRVGSRVLALWINNRFYAGVVTGTVGSLYDVQFDDGDRGRVSLGALRLISQ